jgi:hypothetical protein
VPLQTVSAFVPSSAAPSSRYGRYAPREIRTPTTRKGHKALNLARGVPDPSDCGRSAHLIRAAGRSGPGGRDVCCHGVVTTSRCLRCWECCRPFTRGAKRRAPWTTPIGIWKRAPGRSSSGSVKLGPRAELTRAAEGILGAARVPAPRPWPSLDLNTRSSATAGLAVGARAVRRWEDRAWASRQHASPSTATYTSSRRPAREPRERAGGRRERALRGDRDGQPRGHEARSRERPAVGA